MWEDASEPVVVAADHLVDAAWDPHVVLDVAVEATRWVVVGAVELDALGKDASEEGGEDKNGLEELHFDG